MQKIVDKNQVVETSTYIRNRFGISSIDQAIILGTGLSKTENAFEILSKIPYMDLPFVPVSTTESHKGELILAKYNENIVIIVSGRFHIYEGYSAAESTYLIHVLNDLGVKKLVLTNAVGGVNPHYNEGDIVVVNDHINFFPENPLRGQNDESLGPKFPDMSLTYDKELILVAKKAAHENQVKLKEGVYFGWPGPSLETPAEYRMIHIIGADMVGMSTIPEVIVAKYYGMRIICFSIVSNVCFPLSRITTTTVADVIRVVTSSVNKLSPLILSVVNYK